MAADLLLAAPVGSVKCNSEKKEKKNSYRENQLRHHHHVLFYSLLCLVSVFWMLAKAPTIPHFTPIRPRKPKTICSLGMRAEDK
ncbi:CLUMA_CG010941, isoform A [Clunio marinus]|uniref:CLUMA_CG010941, isoform A n=1 Tax=Clunio marinus TaxID=568069 RepID=A0A1J1ICS5_9DIPT|nr:CLUMA_CG010941, isoform A [Clunio marinus]